MTLHHILPQNTRELRMCRPKSHGESLPTRLPHDGICGTMEGDHTLGNREQNR